MGMPPEVAYISSQEEEVFAENLPRSVSKMSMDSGVILEEEKVMEKDADDEEYFENEQGELIINF
jgi:hypothetical protein